ncbi:MAG TPA: ABC transporter permease [Candidatus Limnocylindrales bacterium]|nr:ABC transporter permease [Candidatus Limnocylindrales bacterium]
MLTIARITVVEASRRRLLLALAILTLAVIGLTAWGFSKLPATTTGPDNTPISPSELRLAASQLTIFIAFMFSGVLALGAVLVASPAISSDIESGIMLAILPRPIRRMDVLVGKWLGLLALVCAYAVVSSTLELGVIWATTAYVPPNPLGAIVFIAAEGAVLMTLTLLLSTRMAPMTSGIIALVGFFVAWMGGIALGFGQVFNNATIENIGLGSRLLLPTDGLWRGAVYEMEPSFVISGLRLAGRGAAGSPFTSLNPAPLAFELYAAGWLVAMLALGIWSFARRDL